MAEPIKLGIQWSPDFQSRTEAGFKRLQKEADGEFLRLVTPYVPKRTVLAGYATAKVVQDGEFVDGLGGGVCQVSSTIFECILRANLQVVCRAPHSLEISYVPLGGDATVQWNTTDFQFKNTSGTDIRLQMTAKNGTLTCKVMGQKNVKPKDVKISIKKTGKQYVLTRTVGGKVNYTTYSTYAKPKKSQ